MNGLSRPGLLLVFVLAGVRIATAAPCELARDGRGLLPVVVSPAATPLVREAAERLAATLGEIGGTTFAVEADTGESGIIVGTAAEWPGLGLAARFDPADPLRREEYILRSEPERLLVVAATPLGVQHAVADVLWRLGVRQYFPGPDWRIVPGDPRLTVEVDVFEAPDFQVRRIINGGGYFDYDEAPTKAWRIANRIGAGLNVANSHVYDAIVAARRAEFEQHPEYLALVDGVRRPIERDENKFCISNPGLRAVVIDWAVQHFESQRDRVDGVSMEPSDGLGWCECEACGRLGSVTDRVVFLANEVAAALEMRFDRDAYVGILAYAAHSPPPTIAVHPKVVISVANGYITGGFTFEELLEAWGKTGRMLGVYDYLGVVQWSWDRPGNGRATRSEYIRGAVPAIHTAGGRLFTGEAEGNWGPAGFGYFMTSRILWDVDEAARYDERFTEFLDRCFRAGAAPVREFYALIDGSRRPLLSRDLIGRMYAALDAAWSAEDSEAVRRRIADLVFYTRYVELFFDYETAPPADQQAAFETLIRFTWSIRHRLMVHAREIYRQLARSNKHVTVPAEVYYKVPDATNIWKQDPAPSDAVASGIITAGLAKNLRNTFEPRAYSRELVPAGPLGLDAPPLRGFPGGTQSYQRFETWVGDPAAAIELEVTGGLIVHYRDRGDARIVLRGPLDPRGEGPKADEARVPPDGKPRAVVLRPLEAGLHAIEVRDGGDRTQLVWPADRPMTVWAADGTAPNHVLAWSAYFFVPCDARRVAGYAAHPSGTLRDADGKKVADFTQQGGPGFFDVPVPPGQAGRLWRFEQCIGQRLLLTVPPCLARSPAELLLPSEVVATGSGP